MLLIRGDVDEPPRDLGEHVELGRSAFRVDDRGVPAFAASRRSVALAAELDDLRQRERRLGGVEAARAARAERVLGLGLQLERRPQRGGRCALARGRKARRVHAQLRVAGERLLDRRREASALRRPPGRRSL